MKPSAAIELQAVSKRFGTFIALDALTLQVETGEIFGLLGPSGSGKTTTVNLLCGLTAPTSGKILVLGHDVGRDPRKVRASLGVDVQSRRALWDHILDLKSKGNTVLITTNYLEEANALCDRLAILDQGKLVALDTPANLKRTYGDTIIDLTTEPATPSDLVRQLRLIPGVTEVIANERALKITVAGGGEATGQIVTLVTRSVLLKNMIQREPNLDEVFLHLTGRDVRD